MIEFLLLRHSGGLTSDLDSTDVFIPMARLHLQPFECIMSQDNNRYVIAPLSPVTLFFFLCEKAVQMSSAREISNTSRALVVV